MNKNDYAPNPPMGWNSYDYYNTEVNEAQVRANAEYMAAHLKEFGWEYVVIDIEWYAVDAGSQSDKYQYIPFGKLVMDEYSRLLPDPVRFPSAAGGKGFRVLAEYIHSLGLKFGIHIMRGIPRAAAHEHRGLLGTEMTADQLADPSNICWWNPDMYGLRVNLPEAQMYYDSIMQLYAEWGVDFIKCDDICREDAVTAHREIELLHNAIMKCGRPIVLSLSPGPAKISEAAFYAANANMWRITDDFWDSWPLLKDMFRRCELWQGQRTMMSLWCICGSPLMIGAELTKLDDFTFGLLTNRDVLDMQRFGCDAIQLERTDEQAIWVAHDPVHDRGYIALFNLADEERAVHCWVGAIEDRGYKAYDGGTIREMWTGAEAAYSTGGLACLVPAHGARVFVY